MDASSRIGSRGGALLLLLLLLVRHQQLVLANVRSQPQPPPPGNNPAEVGQAKQQHQQQQQTTGQQSQPIRSDETMMRPGELAPHQGRSGPEETSVDKSFAVSDHHRRRRLDADSAAGQTEPPHRLKCRVEKDLYLEFEEYEYYSCANCYKHMPAFLFKRKLAYREQGPRASLYDELAERSIMTNESHLIRPTFKSETTYEKWLECCRQALVCCRQNQRYLSAVSDPQRGGRLIDDPVKNRVSCPATWDGHACWPDSPVGRPASQPCPSHVYFLDFEPTCGGTAAVKQCFPNGSWFIRNNHEWTNYSACDPLPHYSKQMLIDAGWYLFSAMFAAPALLVLSRVPSRGGSKRARILQNLIIWLLLNALLYAVQNLCVVGGIFKPNSDRYSGAEDESGWFRRPHQLEPVASAAANHSTPLLERATRQVWPPLLLLNQTSGATQPPQWTTASEHHDGPKEPINHHHHHHHRDRHHPHRASSATIGRENRKGDDRGGGGGGGQLRGFERDEDGLLDPGDKLAMSKQSPHQKQTANIIIGENEHLSSSSARHVERFKRLASKDQYRGHQSSAFIVIVCWILSLGIRITRQLGYAWMFTGAIYLCSVLHYAPAEPPTLFIRWLMIVTNGFPLATGFVYLIVRTIYEPSPLTLIIQYPYYYLVNDQESINFLWATQLKCWMIRSKYDNIEDIADAPNLVFVILNFGLFVVTLIIMCRISRPGSTRHEMSVGDYFKAAGTLVVLYGAHYSLIIYKPPGFEEGCIAAQVFHYAFSFVNGLQGIAVSYVFCYRTQEGKEIIHKWWSSWHDRGPDWCKLKTRKTSSTVRRHSLLNEKHNKSFGQSTRSNNSCNGKDATTELIDINESN